MNMVVVLRLEELKAADWTGGRGVGGSSRDFVFATSVRIGWSWYSISFGRRQFSIDICLVLSTRKIHFTSYTDLIATELYTCLWASFTSTGIPLSLCPLSLGSQDQRQSVEELRKSNSSSPWTLGSRGEGGGHTTTKGGGGWRRDTCWGGFLTNETLADMPRGLSQAWNTYLKWLLGGGKLMAVVQSTSIWMSLRASSSCSAAGGVFLTWKQQLNLLPIVKVLRVWYSEDNISYPNGIDTQYVIIIRMFRKPQHCWYSAVRANIVHSSIV